MSRPRVGNLVVCSREMSRRGHNDVQLPLNSTRYRMVEAIVHLAISLLETPQGRQSLVDVAAAIIQARGTAHIYQDSMDNLPYWIQRFLNSIRRNFPPVCIAGNTRGEAEAERFDWGTDVDMDMSRYDAGPAVGVLYLSEAVISNMTYVRQQDRVATSDSYNIFKFQMTISVAHEIVHFLTGYLASTTAPDTPPTVTAEPYGDGDEMGEAGRYWESILLGGFLECWSSPSDPLRDRQAGTPYLFGMGSLRSATGQEVSMAYVEELLNERFSFPIRASSQSRPVTRRDLGRQSSHETTILRNSEAARYAGRANSPPPDHPSASVRYRSLVNPGPASGYTATERPSRRFFR